MKRGIADAWPIAPSGSEPAATKSPSHLPPLNVAPVDNYLVSVIISGKEPGIPVPGHLRVVAESDLAVKLTDINPLTQYPEPTHGGYDLLLVGENFAREAQDNIIEVEGRLPLARWISRLTRSSATPNCVFLLRPFKMSREMENSP